MSRREKFEIYRDKAGEWRWRLIARNGKIVADSGEGYKRSGGAKRGIKAFTRLVMIAYDGMEIVLFPRRG